MEICSYLACIFSGLLMRWPSPPSLSRRTSGQWGTQEGGSQSIPCPLTRRQTCTESRFCKPSQWSFQSWRLREHFIKNIKLTKQQHFWQVKQSIFLFVKEAWTHTVLWRQVHICILVHMQSTGPSPHCELQTPRWWRQKIRSVILYLCQCCRSSDHSNTIPPSD